MATYVAQQAVKQMIHVGSSIKGSKVIVLGLTFKENCPDLRNSKVADMVAELREFGCEVYVHDPIADPVDSREEYGIELTPWERLPVAEAIIAAVPHHDFMAVPLEDILSLLKPDGVFVDVKSAFDAQSIRSREIALWRL
jgi:UDP-N-acetyl-D-galactosamine dehydrogenase